MESLGISSVIGAFFILMRSFLFTGPLDNFRIRSGYQKDQDKTWLEFF